VDAERQRLLRDMHDGVGGMLTHLLLQARDGRLTTENIEQGLQSAVDDLRNMASAIDANHEPIDEALAVFHERMASRLSHSGIAFDWNCQLSMPAPSMDARRLLNLYRLLQEGISNALRHAGASRLELWVESCGDDSILVMLSDNGTGFDPENTRHAVPGEGHGLANMRRRAEQLGGHLRIESTPGQGCRLILSIPIIENNRAS
jgi:signal transduction histidine kinase